MRLLLALVTLAALPAVAGRTAAQASTATRGVSRCPVLVLSAMPLEVAPLLAKAQVDATPVWVHDGKGFWAGTLERNPVVVALTGIGIVNATDTVEAAFGHFGCFSLVVFSGTSGGEHIGDVMIPDRWTHDGQSFVATSRAALAVLSTAVSHQPALEQTTPAGDPLCTCVTAGAKLPDTPVTVQFKPQIRIGGDGVSHDGFGGRALPCSPAADDVLGCWPCKFPDTAAAVQAQNLAGTVPPFLDPAFFLDYQSNSATPRGNYVSDDMETAAAFAVASAHGVPVIGFRSASDGGGDPLHLPGFPAEFLVYRQLAADNAASVTLAFLAAWQNR